jgi:uncharacterized protein YqhQ
MKKDKINKKDIFFSGLGASLFLFLTLPTIVLFLIVLFLIVVFLIVVFLLDTPGEFSYGMFDGLLEILVLFLFFILAIIINKKIKNKK